MTLKEADRVAVVFTAIFTFTDINLGSLGDTMFTDPASTAAGK